MSSSSKKKRSPFLGLAIVFGAVVLVAASLAVFQYLDKNIGLVSTEVFYEEVQVAGFEKTHSHGRRGGSGVDSNYRTIVDYQGMQIAIQGRMLYEALQPYEGEMLEARIEKRTYENGDIQFEVLEIGGIPQSEFNAGILSGLFG